MYAQLAQNLIGDHHPPTPFSLITRPLRKKLFYFIFFFEKIDCGTALPRPPQVANFVHTALRTEWITDVTSSTREIFFENSSKIK